MKTKIIVLLSQAIVIPIPSSVTNCSDFTAEVDSEQSEASVRRLNTYRSASPLVTVSQETADPDRPPEETS